MIPSVHALLDTLRKEGEVATVDVPVDTNLEIAEIHRRVIAGGGPALLFTRPHRSVAGPDGPPRAYDMPVFTNAFGTKRRVDLTFGGRPRAFIARTVKLMHELVPPTLGKLWDNRDYLRAGLNIGMSRRASGPVTGRVVRKGGLDALPLLKSWPEDGGDFVTLPLVYTEHPETGLHNLGMYRVQRHGVDRTGMHWQIGKGGGFHHAVAQKKGEDLPVTVFVGGPPALIVSAIAPLPENVPELLLASLLLGERLPMCDNPAGPHRLVAEAEVAIVGHVGPSEVYPEGPFGDHYGFYSLKHDYPVLHVDAVCSRTDAIWPATVVGKPRQEDLYIGDYLQELLSPLFPVVMPNVKDLWSYGETGYHALAGAVVEQRYRREAVQAALRILGEGQLSLTKFLWVVDEKVDLRDARATLAHLLARFRPETDLYVLANVSMDTLDYTGPEVNLGSKAVMLGLGEPWRELPRDFRGDLPGGVRRVAVFCPGCLVVEGPSHAEDPAFAERVAGAFPAWPLVVLADDAVATAAKQTRFLWSTFMRMEPAADLYATTTRIARNHLVRSGTVVMDSRLKGHHPGELLPDDATKRLVTDRWKEYFPNGDVPMGDGDQGHLDAC